MVLEDIRTSTDLVKVPYYQSYMRQAAANDAFEVRGVHGTYYIVSTVSEMSTLPTLIERMKKDDRLNIYGVYDTYIHTKDENGKYIPFVNIGMRTALVHHPLVVEQLCEFVQNYQRNEMPPKCKPKNWGDGDIFRDMISTDMFIETFGSVCLNSDHFVMNGYRTEKATTSIALTTHFEGDDLVDIYKREVHGNTTDDTDAFIFNLRLLGLAPAMILEMCLYPTYSVNKNRSYITYNHEKHDYLMALGRQQRT